MDSISLERCSKDVFRLAPDLPGREWFSSPSIGGLKSGGRVAADLAVSCVSDMAMWEAHVRYQSTLPEPSQYGSLAWHRCSVLQSRLFDAMWKDVAEGPQPALGSYSVNFHRSSYTTVKYVLVATKHLCYFFGCWLCAMHFFEWIAGRLNRCLL